MVIFLMPLNSKHLFQHTAARRRLVLKRVWKTIVLSFNTQPPEGGWGLFFFASDNLQVSTHSRPKAADLHNTISS